MTNYLQDLGCITEHGRNITWHMITWSAVKFIFGWVIDNVASHSFNHPCIVHATRLLAMYTLIFLAASERKENFTVEKGD